jgi:hypothetical protein
MFYLLIVSRLTMLYLVLQRYGISVVAPEFFADGLRHQLNMSPRCGLAYREDVYYKPHRGDTR